MFAISKHCYRSRKSYLVEEQQEQEVATGVSCQLPFLRRAVERKNSWTRLQIGPSADQINWRDGIEHLENFRSTPRWKRVARHNLISKWPCLNIDSRRQELNLMEKLIREMLSESQNQHLDTDSALVKLKSEMLSVKNEMSGSEQRSSDLQHDVRILEKVATDSLRALVATKREMQSVQDEIALMYTRSDHQLNLFSVCFL